jgi:autotransporter-associated beta strand protein
VSGSGKNQIAGSAQYIVDGLLDLRGFDFDTSRMASGLGTIDSTVFGASGCVLNVGNSGILSTFSGQIKDSGWDATHKLSLTKGGSVDFQLGGTNSYHGDTTVGQAVLRLTSDAAIPHGVGFGNLSLSGGTLDLNGNNIILNGLNGSSALNDSVNTATNLIVGDAGAAGNHTGGMTGAFGVTKIGSGVQSFGGTKGYTGATVVSNGTLRINGTLSASPVTVIAGATLGGTGVISSNAVVSGTLSPGTTGIGGIEVTLGTTFQPGSTLFMELNKASATTNDALIGPVSAGGNLVVTNIGAALLVGDRFQLFSVAPTGAFASTVLPTGYTWSNSIATDGAIQVLTVPSSVPTTPTNLTFTASGGSLTLSWPANYLGWSLQAQTNGLSVGLNTNWVTIPGSATNTTMVIPMNPANGAVFYRMFYHP